MPADLVDIFRENGFKMVKKTAKEWATACPSCGGTDRCSVWPDKRDGHGYYWCRQCDARGDGVQFLRDYAGMSYADACQRMGVTASVALHTPTPARAKAEDVFEPTNEKLGQLDGVDTDLWQQKAAAFLSWTVEELAARPRALAWLAARGIDATQARRYRLGYNPGEKGQNCMVRARSGWGLPPEKKQDGSTKKLWLPRGFIIPRLGSPVDGVRPVQRLRIRRPDADRKKFNEGLKYFVVPGSGMDMLWLSCTSSQKSGRPVVVVESELDAILLHIVAGDMMHCVAAMTASVRHLATETFDALKSAPCILVALDNDKAGAEGWQRWASTFPRAKRWPIPAGKGKDPGEAWAKGLDLRTWLLAGIPAGLRPALLAMEKKEIRPSEILSPLDPVEAEAAAAEQVEGVEEQVEVENYHGIGFDRQGRPIVPDIVLQAHEMWQRVPVEHRKVLNKAGEVIGFEWSYNYAWAAKNKNQGKVHEFIKFFNSHEILWHWLDLNPSDRVTAGNFLEV